MTAETSRGRTRARATDLDEIRFGREEIELQGDQLVDPSQTRSIAQALLLLVSRGMLDGRRNLLEAIGLLERELDTAGLEVFADGRGTLPGDLARPRSLEIGAAVNRLRTLSVRQQRD